MEPNSLPDRSLFFDSVYRGEDLEVIPPIAHYPNWAFRCPACNRTYELPQEMSDVKGAHENGTLHYFRPCGCMANHG
jgi:hypothetical protein